MCSNYNKPIRPTSYGDRKAQASYTGADPGFVERAGGGGGGAAATASAAGAKVFGGSRLKTLFGISKGGARPLRPPPPPESASGIYMLAEFTFTVIDFYFSSLLGLSLLRKINPSGEEKFGQRIGEKSASVGEKSASVGEKSASVGEKSAA